MQERAEVTRRSILAAAALLFERHGYVGTSISDVARTSGYTSGAIYFHFGNKEGLAQSVLDAYFGEWPRLVEKWRSRGGPVLDRTVGLSLEVAREYRDNLIVRAGNRLWNEHKSIPTHLPQPFVGWISTVAELLAEARDAGELAAGTDVSRAARVVVAGFFGSHSISDALDRRRSVEEAVAEFWLLVLPGLQAEPDPEGCLERVRGRLPRRPKSEAAAAV
ncbi:ScbR family autoregulator-binding transcription factor [Streptomyces geranii]|uniref:ScbR family autoregulator-binding transcription factor n=1 Tax=Streptomyces geranii TaxID=2058923 RepID=UPI000D03A4E8|nr:ScbR family autoregulator-binding transcription factor [Streptomyces geranii]